MIKFLGQRNGRPMIGLGLSRGNCDRLIEGRPIFIDLKVMLADLPDYDLNEAVVLIFGGETEEAMLAEMERVSGQKFDKPRTHHDEN